MRHPLWLILALLLFAAVGASAAHADTVTDWTVSGLTFSNGDTLSGGFDYDSTTGKYSSVNLLLETSGGATVATFTANPYGSCDGSTDCQDFQSGVGYLVLNEMHALQGYSGTTDSIIQPIAVGSSFAGTQIGLGANSYAGEAGGELIAATPAPEPSSLALTLFGLGFWGIVMRKRIALGRPNAR